MKTMRALVLTSTAILCVMATTPPSSNYIVSDWHAGTRCEEGDINALFKWRGKWHLMHQYRDRPNTSIGHQVSPDLIHWRRLPDALKSGPSADQQCYDGGVSIVPKHGISQPMLMIDGGCARLRVDQGKQPFCMESTGNNSGGVTAFPANLSDPELSVWTREGPTMWEPCNASAWPSPIWRNPVTGKFELTAVTGNNQARFEAADDTFTRWVEKDSEFFSGIKGLGGGMWHEIPPNVDGVPGKPWATHVFQGALGSAFNGLPNFVMGVYDPLLERFSNVSSPILLDGGGGVNYGQLSWNDNTTDKRVIFVSWLRLTESTPPDCGTGGQVSALRDLRYDPRLDTLVHEPIAEYAQLRSTVPLFRVSQQIVKQGAPTVLYDGGAVAGKSCGGTTCGVSMDSIFNISIPADPTAAANFVVALRCSDSESCKEGAQVTLAIAPASDDGRRAATLHVDYAYHIQRSLVILEGERSVPLRVMSDRRSLEIFAGPNGRAAISITMLSESGQVTVAALGSDIQVSAEGWTMVTI